MGRPSVITPQVAARIAAERAPGLSVRALRARLAAAGVHVALATLQRHLARPQGDSPAPLRGDLSAHLASRPKPAPAEPPAELAPDDDLGHLARRRDELQRALDLWQPQLGATGAAVRAYRGVMAELRATTATLVELRPRPEVEADRLEVLGAEQRAALLDRARAVALADEDLRGQVRRALAAIDSMVDAGAD
ncbi:MAG TPA: hypothetical protein VHP33_03255 [Polyangiaceae bacterium]|nr:hypothetical protein [Polyangiaceae bacterium]